MKTLLIALLAFVVLMSSFCFAEENGFKSLESLQVTKDEVYWSFLARNKLLSRPDMLEDFYKLAHRYTMRGKDNPINIQHLDRIRFSRHASEITNGNPEFMVSKTPNIRMMMFNRTVGTPKDFFIKLRRKVLNKEINDDSIHAETFFKELSAPMDLSFRDIIKNDKLMAQVHNTQQQIISGSKKHNLFSHIADATSSFARFRIPRLKPKRSHKQQRKAAKRAKKAAEDFADDDNDEDGLTIKINNQFTNCDIEIKIGNHYNIDADAMFKKQSEIKKSIDEKYISLKGKVEKLQQSVDIDTAIGRDIIDITKQILEISQGNQKKLLKKEDFEKRIDALEKQIGQKMGSLLKEVFANGKEIQDIRAKNDIILAYCKKNNEFLAQESAARDAEIVRRNQAMKRDTIGQSFLLAANIVSLAGGNKDLTDGFMLASEVVPQSMEAIDSLTAIFSQEDIDWTKGTELLTAIGDVQKLAVVGLKIVAFFMNRNIKSADEITHDYLRALAKHLKGLHKEMRQGFQHIDKKIVLLIQQSEVILECIAENKALIQTIGDDLKKIHRDKFITALLKNESFLQTMIETELAMDNAKFSELITEFVLFANRTSGSETFVGYPNLKNRDDFYKLLELNQYNVNLDQVIFPIARAQDYMGNHLTLMVDKPGVADLAFAGESIHPGLWHRNVKNMFDLITHAETLMKDKDVSLLRVALRELNKMKQRGMSMNRLLKAVCNPEIMQQLLETKKQLLMYYWELEEYKALQPSCKKLVTTLHKLALQHDAKKWSAEWSKLSNSVVVRKKNRKKITVKGNLENFEYKELIESRADIKASTIRLKKVLEYWSRSYGYCDDNGNWRSMREEHSGYIQRKVLSIEPKDITQANKVFINSWAKQKRQDIPGYIINTYHKKLRENNNQKHLDYLNQVNVFGKKLKMNEVSHQKLEAQMLYVDAVICFALQLMRDANSNNPAYTQALLEYQQVMNIPRLLERTEARANKIADGILSNMHKANYKYDKDQRPIWIETYFNKHFQIFLNKHYHTGNERYTHAMAEVNALMANINGLTQNNKAKWMHPSLEKGVKLIELLEAKP